MKKRVFLFLLAAAFAALACGVAAAAPKDEIVVGTASDAKSLDPQMANDTSSSCALIQMYEPLFEFSPDKKLVGYLAESWKQLDPTTWEITLRKGIKFHNGDELTAEDAVFTLQQRDRKSVV